MTTPTPRHTRTDVRTKKRVRRARRRLVRWSKRIMLAMCGVTALACLDVPTDHAATWYAPPAHRVVCLPNEVTQFVGPYEVISLRAPHLHTVSATSIWHAGD